MRIAVGMLVLIFTESCCPRTGSRDPSTLRSAPVRVEWSVTPSAGGLLVRYTVRNDGESSVWLADGYEGNNRLVVRNYAPGVVAFSAERSGPDPNIIVEHAELHLPGLHELAAHGSFSRTVIVPLPLRAWHYLGEDAVNALRPATHAVLEIGYLPSNPGFHPSSTTQGCTANTPAALLAFQKQVIVRGAPLDLP